MIVRYRDIQETEALVVYKARKEIQFVIILIAVNFVEVILGDF